MAIVCPRLWGTEVISPEIALRQFTLAAVILLFCNLLGMQGTQTPFRGSGVLLALGKSPVGGTVVQRRPRGAICGGKIAAGV